MEIMHTAAAQRTKTNERLKTIFTDNEMSRIFLYPGGEGQLPGCSVDVHGMHKPEANRFVKNVIAIIRVPFRLTVIHGYNSGTELLRMFRENFSDARVNGYCIVPKNPGVTIFLVGQDEPFTTECGNAAGQEKGGKKYRRGQRKAKRLTGSVTAA